MIEFVAGQKVVCVNADPDFVEATGSREMDGLTEGAIYTIRWIGSWKLPPWYPHNRICVHLVEIDRSTAKYDVPYDARRFRPLREIKTDISIFERILDEVNQQNREVVG